MIGDASVITESGALISSKMTPRLTANGSLRWPTKRRPGTAQPGMFAA